jgi:hypothetical protein
MYSAFRVWRSHCCCCKGKCPISTIQRTLTLAHKEFFVLSTCSMTATHASARRPRTVLCSKSTRRLAIHDLLSTIIPKPDSLLIFIPFTITSSFLLLFQKTCWHLSQALMVTLAFSKRRQQDSFKEKICLKTMMPLNQPRLVTFHLTRHLQ